MNETTDLSIYKAALLFLATAGVVAPLFFRLRISPVLGYLLAGVALGPYGLGSLDRRAPWLNALAINVEAIDKLAAFGVVALLFTMGLELSFERLRLTRRLVFGLGLQLLRLLSDPGDDAGRTDQRRAEEIAQRLRGPILGDELLDIKIDRRRLDALAILGGRDHAVGKRRLGHAAAIFAAVNRGLMFGDHERALGKIEHLALLDPRGPPRIERQTAMAACARLMPDRAIGIGDLQQSAALVAGLAAADLARAAAQAAGDARLLLQPVARRRLGAVRAVLPQLAAKVRQHAPFAVSLFLE